MKKLYSTMINMPVISFQSENTIAVCKELIFDDKDLSCKVLRVGSKEFFKKEEKFIIWDDILEISNGFYIQSQEVLIDANELVRHQEIIERNCLVVNMTVKTQSGQVVGVVNDYTINTEMGLLEKIYIRSGSLFLGENRIISRTQIVTIEDDTIIVYDALLREENEVRSMKKVKRLNTEPSMTLKK